MSRKRIFFWIQIIIIIYCAAGIALYYLQTRFLFHPTKLAADHTFNIKVPFKEFLIPVNKTDTISVVKFIPADSIPKGVVIYFHGNMHNVEFYAPFAQQFTKHGYEVWMPDYPGFGKSTGELSEKKLYDVAWQVQRLALSNYTGSNVIIYGKSLGTGVAAYAATVATCRALVLETPYYSITDLFNHYAWMYPVSLMVKYTIPTHTFLEDVKAPVTIFHGTDDNVIPYSCAEKLKGNSKKGDLFITIPGGSHRDIAAHAEYIHAMDSLLKN
ncbi:MAG: alpha/beta fold hydrolase [Bacteroidetes bacterium]|nr:alpha/beta fold hydrolase [Bacteroidota bacterium]